HVSAERVSRGVAGLAGAGGEPFRVPVEDWTVAGTETAGPPLGLPARAQGLVLDLELHATNPLVLHGERGLSAKSEEAGNASYYVGYTRMTARGRIGAGGGGAVAGRGRG